MTRLCCIKA